MNFNDIRRGTRVTILVRNGTGLNLIAPGTYERVPQYVRRTGRAVMRSGDGRGWVLNLGGQHGTPGLAYPDNTVKVH